MDEQLVGQVIDGYIVGPLIAIGGMGRIYQALNERTRQTAAIKLLTPEFARDDNFRTRFWREAELMSTLDHPHIIPIYRYGEWSGYLDAVGNRTQLDETLPALGSGFGTGGPGVGVRASGD